ncbi:EAL domain-containing protein, partial [Klebsiella pneumoniae]|uniref:EAL domain-containing protein n=1 Tax=Klebsiella pneumoniae TaxID=573 RepID=UPI0027308A12
TAVGERRTFLVYQPIFDSASRKLIGNEALMRMRDRDGALIGPAVFIPVAEETGMISCLGAWAIGQACEDMLHHDLGDIVSVNMSA